MALGRQFENTYWEDPKSGGTYVWARKGNAPAGGYYSTHEGEHIPITELSDNSSSLQGLLFHPLTGTGLKGDPMVPEETRKGVIQRALGLTDVKKYKQNLGDVLGTITRRSTNRIDRNSVQRADISDKVAEKHIEWITNTLNESEMPTHVIEQRSGVQTNLDPQSAKRPIRTVLDPIPGRAWAEANGSAIRLTMPDQTRTKRVTTREMVNVPSTTPIANPKFWEHLDKARRNVNRGDSHNVVSADAAFALATHWVNPTTGHVMTKEFAENLPIDYSADPPGEYMENPMETPALVLKTMGYVPNLFPGKGNATAKSHSVGTHGKIETGYGDTWVTGREYTHATFHTRYTPGTQEEREVTKNVRVDPVLNQTTMTHELGHALDTAMSDTYTNRGNYEYTRKQRDPWSRTGRRTVTNTVIADPVEEGIADASADRYTRYRGRYADALANLETRASDFENTGYTLGYSGWKTKGQRALYVASRYHNALSDDKPQPIIGKDALYKMLPKDQQNLIDSRSGNNQSLDIMNDLALGYMYHHMPHIHGILRQTGLEDVAKQAHEEYKKRMGLIPADQPTLPGMEKFV